MHSIVVVTATSLFTRVSPLPAEHFRALAAAVIQLHFSCLQVLQGWEANWGKRTATATQHIAAKEDPNSNTTNNIKGTKESPREPQKRKEPILTPRVCFQLNSVFSKCRPEREEKEKAGYTIQMGNFVMICLCS